MHGKSKIFGVLGFATLVIAMTAVFSMFGITDAGAQSSNVVVFATGLNNPRGLKFGPDNNLYVAEGGLGGTSINTIGLLAGAVTYRTLYDGRAKRPNFEDRFPWRRYHGGGWFALEPDQRSLGWFCQRRGRCSVHRTHTLRRCRRCRLFAWFSGHS